MQKLKNLLFGLVVTSGLVLAVSAIANPVAFAQTKADLCEGVGLVGGSSDCSQAEGTPTVDSTIENVVTILSIVVGVISVIMIIVGGLKYITSGGDSSKVSSAKDTILYAVIGLVVVAMAQVIVRFVLNETAG